MRVILSGGGTGGHIYPALALSEAVLHHEPDSEFLYVGSERGVEANIVPKTGMPFKQLVVQGFKRSLSFENIKTIRLFLKAVKQAKKLFVNSNQMLLLVLGDMSVAQSSMQPNNYIYQQLFMNKTL